MELLWILYFAVQILAVPTVIGAVLAFFLTRQQNDEGRIWRVVGYIVYTLLFAAVSYYLFFSRPRQCCDFGVLLILFSVAMNKMLCKRLHY